MRRWAASLAVASLIPALGAAQSLPDVTDCLQTSVQSGLAGALTGLAGIPKINGNLMNALLGSAVLACTGRATVAIENSAMGRQLIEDVVRFKKLQSVINTEHLLAWGDMPGSLLRFGPGGLTFSAATFSDLSAEWLKNALSGSPASQALGAFDHLAGLGGLSRIHTTQWFAGHLLASERSGASAIATAKAADSAANDMAAVTVAYEAAFDSASPSSGRSNQVVTDLAIRRALAMNQRLGAAIADLRNTIDLIAAKSGASSALHAVAGEVRP